MNLNFLVNNLSSSQLSHFLLNNINWDIIKKDRINCDHMIFFEDISRLNVSPLCALMHINEGYGAEGNMIATCCGTAGKMLSFLGQSAKQKFLYVWDLEWIRGSGNDRQFEYFSNIYTHPHIQLIARNEEHAKLIKNSFNVEVVGCVADFDIEEIERIVENVR